MSQTVDALDRFSVAESTDEYAIAASSNKKAVICTNSAWTLFHFRGSLMKALQGKGFEVIAVGPRDKYASMIESSGVRFIHVPMSQVGMNPMDELKTTLQLFKVYRRERPALVHNFSIKAILYGTLAARLAGVPAIVNTVTGLGSGLGNARGVMRVIRPIVLSVMRWSMRPPVRVTFQNDHSRDFFVGNRIVRDGQASLIRGSGVDPDAFTPAEHCAPCDGSRPVRFLMFSRMIWEKGVNEYCRAAERIAERHGCGRSAEFTMIGGSTARNETGVEAEWLANPDTIPGDWLEAEAAKNNVRWLPHQERMIDFIREADVVVLPSYYPEGLPRSLLEAMSCGKAIITTDTPGCRDVVANGENGLLIQPRDIDALEQAFEYFIDRPGDADRMGQASRRRLIDTFSDRTVIEQTFAQYALAGLPV